MALSIRARPEFADDSYAQAAQALIRSIPRPLAAMTRGPLQPESVCRRPLPRQRPQLLRGSIVAQWQLGAGMLSSCTGYSDADFVFFNNVTDHDTIQSTTASHGNVEVRLVDPFNFSPSDTSQASLPDPWIVGVRFNFRFGGN